MPNLVEVNEGATPRVKLFLFIFQDYLKTSHVLRIQTKITDPRFNQMPAVTDHGTPLWAARVAITPSMVQACLNSARPEMGSKQYNPCNQICGPCIQWSRKVRDSIVAPTRYITWRQATVPLSLTLRESYATCRQPIARRWPNNR